MFEPRKNLCSIGIRIPGWPLTLGAQVCRAWREGGPGAMAADTLGSSCWDGDASRQQAHLALRRRPTKIIAPVTWLIHHFLKRMEGLVLDRVTLCPCWSSVDSVFSWCYFLQSDGNQMFQSIINGGIQLTILHTCGLSIVFPKDFTISAPSASLPPLLGTCADMSHQFPRQTLLPLGNPWLHRNILILGHFEIRLVWFHRPVAFFHFSFTHIIPVLVKINEYLDFKSLAECITIWFWRRECIFLSYQNVLSHTL